MVWPFIYLDGQLRDPLGTGTRSVEAVQLTARLGITSKNMNVIEKNRISIFCFRKLELSREVRSLMVHGKIVVDCKSGTIFVTVPSHSIFRFSPNVTQTETMTTPAMSCSHASFMLMPNVK
jgi:hypothetical protein